MANPNKLKQKFLKKWLVGLHACSSSNTKMDILQRKNAIKLSADVAMASSRKGTTIWSRAIISKAMKGHADQAPAELDLGRHIREKLPKEDSGPLRRKKTTTLQKLSRRVCRRVTKGNFPQSQALARSVAKRLVQKRTKVLRSLVPGGEFMEDEVLLMEEALDYVSFLRAQVDGMRFLANCQ